MNCRSVEPPAERAAERAAVHRTRLLVIAVAPRAQGGVGDTLRVEAALGEMGSIVKRARRPREGRAGVSSAQGPL